MVCLGKFKMSRDIHHGFSKLINAIEPGLIDEKKIINKKNPNAYEILINHDLAIQGAIELGCSVVNIGSKDIYDGDVCFSFVSWS